MFKKNIFTILLMLLSLSSFNAFTMKKETPKTKALPKAIPTLEKKDEFVGYVYSEKEKGELYRKLSSEILLGYPSIKRLEEIRKTLWFNGLDNTPMLKVIDDQINKQLEGLSIERLKEIKEILRLNNLYFKVIDDRINKQLKEQSIIKQAEPKKVDSTKSKRIEAIPVEFGATSKGKVTKRGPRGEILEVTTTPN